MPFQENFTAKMTVAFRAVQHVMELMTVGISLMNYWKAVLRLYGKQFSSFNTRNHGKR